MSGKWDSIVFHPITLKIPLCSRGKLKILFLAVFETGLVRNESEEFVYVYFLAYLLAYSVSRQVWIQRLTLADIVFTASAWFEFLPALQSVNCVRKSSLEFPRYYATSDILPKFRLFGTQEAN